ncbi:hypothetical protein Smp_155900 [Schistosoma mansoni]|uniref:hypothetical protein n=1 Tax=Schistosoma mansoni TaxID=6183 RepID=UPI00022DC434|nr:hypothetical protein Smp_155900 [Schistosoma mansoni]|eukprot:XP_018652100.1 hypothetical protein Smp_155900 [Schistosoma mansoni]
MFSYIQTMSLNKPTGILDAPRSDPETEDRFASNYTAESLVRLSLSTHSAEDVPIYANGPYKKDDRRQISSQLKHELCNILEHFNSLSAYALSLGSSQAETEHIIDFSMCGISLYRFSKNYPVITCQSRSGLSVTMRHKFKDARL